MNINSLETRASLIFIFCATEVAIKRGRSKNLNDVPSADTYIAILA